MADCNYEVVNVDGNNIVVKYSLGEHSITVHLHWSGEGDIHEYIKAHVPSENLKAMAKGPLDKGKLVGVKGTASMELPSHIPVKAEEPTESTEPKPAPLPGSGV